MDGSNYFAQPYFGQGYSSYIRWGVDSTTHVNAPVPGGEFFEVVAAQAGRRPDFWGRYIGHPNSNFNLARDEVTYLAGKNCRILVVYGGTTQAQVEEPNPAIARQNGINAAQTAIARARELCIPGGVPGGKKRVWIYCDIENTWTPTVDFFGGWFDTMQASEYGGGVYGDTHNPDPLPPNAFSAPYCAAYAAYPSMRDANAPALLWNIRPQRPCNTQQGFGNGPNARGFNPDRPPCNPPTGIYQYTTSTQNFPCKVGPSPGTEIDLDLADGVGFESMWAPAKWKWRKIKHESDFGDFPVHPVEYNDSGNIFVAWHATTLNRKVVAKSTDSGQTWTNFEDGNLNADLRGSIVRRGAAIDYYANLPEAGTAALHIKRYTFDGTAWQAAVTLLQKTSATHAGIRRPYAFRDPLDNSRRALVWLENERRNEVGSGGGPASASETYPWVDEGLYGKCGWCDDPNPPGGSECGSAAAGRGQYCHTALYERWGLSAPNSGTTQDISGLGGLSLRSYVTVRGIEVTATMSRSGFGGPHPGYERPDLTNSARFRDLNCTGSFGAPAGTQDDCTAPHTNVTTSGGASLRLKKSDGSLGSSKPLGDGTVVYGSATDKWGLAWSPNDFVSFAAQVQFSFGFTDEIVINNTTHPVITLQGSAPPPAPSGSISVSVNSVRVYYEVYGTLWCADLDASGNLVSVTKLKDGLPVSESYNGYFNAGGDPVVSWLEPNLDALVHRRTRVGGVWGAESTHAASATDWGDQMVPAGRITQSGVFNASLKEDLSRFHGMRYDGLSFAFTRRDTCGGVANDEVINDLRGPAVASLGPGPEAVNMDGHGMAQRQKGAALRMVLVTDDNVAFDVWYVTRDE